MIPVTFPSPSKEAMASSRRRRCRRLQLGANRKSTAFRWIGGWTVRVHFSREKAEERAEKSKPSRGKTRRGLRGGACGLERILVDRESAKLLVSAVRNAAPGTSPALAEKKTSSRVVNHQGRKHLWAVMAGNRIASQASTKRLVKRIPDDFGYLSRSRAKKAVEGLGMDSEQWKRFARSWHVYSYKCRYMGAVASRAGKDPLSFLTGLQPKVGANDLLDFLSRSDLPRPEPPPVGRSVVANLVVCSCGTILSNERNHRRRFGCVGYR